MQGSGLVGQVLGAEMLERRREPRLSWDCKAPPSETIQRPPKSADWGLWLQPRVLRPGLAPQEVKTQLAASQPVRVAGSRPQGPGAFSPQKPQTSQITIFRKPPAGSLAKAWVSAETAASEVGTWRETKPGYPPTPPFGFSPSPPSATIQHAPQGRRISAESYLTQYSTFHVLFHSPHITPI